MEADIYEGLNEKIFALESQLEVTRGEIVRLEEEVIPEISERAAGLESQLEQERERVKELEGILLEYESINWMHGHIKDMIFKLRPGAALLERLQQTEKALKLICLDIAEDCCPCEFYGVKWEKCDTCTHDHEIHADADRDVNCWLEYYLQQARGAANDLPTL